MTSRQSHLNLRVNAEEKMELQEWILQDNEDSEDVVKGFRKLRVAGLASFRGESQESFSSQVTSVFGWTSR